MKNTKTAHPKKARPEWSYVPAQGHWDEAFQPSGQPRKAWRQLAVGVGRMGQAALNSQWKAGQQLIQTFGITYNVYGDPQGKERPWLLDPIPLVIGAEEWAYIEQAITQRAMLLNGILADLYGPQRLIKERGLPAALLYDNPNFLRPCYGIAPPEGVFLHTYAADLARSPTGQWWVLSDRTQGPSGIGYALENRLVSARTLSSVFSQSHVRPLTGFLDLQRMALDKLGLARSANPRVVVLTPGPHNETYFEHSLLARHWGMPLVEGADLVVRDNRVFLKTLDGLQPVDVVLRRMDDSYCDPLELRGDSLLGIPGFTQAARTGNVAVANALGSGLLETSSHMAFLPGLCSTLLGEPLRMPSVATWWCGQEDARKFVKEHLDELVVKPAFPRPGQNAQFPGRMSSDQRETLLRQMEARPEDFVAQELVALSTVPTRTDHGLAPRHMVLRVFAAWDGGGYTVMPGGLTRVSTVRSSLVVSMQMGGGSKDTWVLGSPAESLRFRESANIVRTPPGQTALPSRVADNLFWMGRYSERVEAGVRLVRALLPSLSGEEDFGESASIETAGQFLDAMGYLPEGFTEMSLAQRRWHLERVLSSMVYDQTRLSGIGWNLNSMRRVAWPLKPRFSQDTWRLLQRLDSLLSSTRPVSRSSSLTHEIDLLDRVIETLAAFSGLVMENTTRGHGWHFLQIGKRVERGLQLLELLSATFRDLSSELDPSIRTLLQIADSSITYRSRYFTLVRPEHVLELLLFDEANPRSVAFQLACLVEYLHHLPGASESDPAPQQALANEALARLREASLDELATPNENGELPALEQLGQQLKGKLYDISDAISARHFSHLTAVRFTPLA